jgi:dihydrofolate reductase
MRDIVIVEYLSLDGVLQAPGHSSEDTAGEFRQGGWSSPFMAAHRRYNEDLFRGAGGFLLGRLTYEIFADVWPSMTAPDDVIAQALNNKPKFVLSDTLIDPPWQSTTVIRGGDVPAQISKLKEQAGHMLLVIGSSQVAQMLTREGLVDEYQLWIHPVLLGAGKRLFAVDAPRADLRLVDSRTTGGGLVILTYRSAN